ncbi:MAG: CBS domain-containing protein, partial [Planctomycetota bacterium]
SRPVETLDPSDHLETAALLMLRHKIGGVPVVQGGVLAGIITESDIFRALWGVLSSGQGTRVILEEPATGIDFLSLLLKHHCQLQTLMRFAPAAGPTMSHLRVEGSETKALVEDLWSLAARVLSVEGAVSSAPPGSPSRS